MLDPTSLPDAARMRFEHAFRQAMAQVSDIERAGEMAKKSLELSGWEQTASGWIAKARFHVGKDGWTARVPIVRKQSKDQLAFGWASIAVRKDGTIVTDSQEDIIRVNQLERAAYGYVIRSRDASEMHDKRGVAVLVESCVFTPEKRLAMGLPIDSGPTGWWVGYQIRDPEVWRKVESGEYAELSIGGRGVRQEVSGAL